MVTKSLRLLFLVPDTPGLAVGEVWEYLDRQGISYAKITHPIAPVPRARVSNLNGRRIRREPKLGPLSHLGDYVLTSFPVLNNLTEHYDYAICITPHMALAGLWLKKIKRVDKVVYWSLDYYPKRYGAGGKVSTGRAGELIELVYRTLDKFLVRNCDILWTVTNIMLQGWEDAGYTWTAPVRRVPNMIRERQEPVSWDERESRLIWSGTAREGEGLELLHDNWEYLEEILEGWGRFRPELVITCRTKFPPKFDSFVRSSGVTFKGFLPELKDVKDLVRRSLLSLATYQTPSYKKYSDASRIKTALSVGTPTIVSGIQELGKEVQERGAGIYISYHKTSLARAIEGLMDRRENEKASWASYELAEDYLVESVMPAELKFLQEAK